MSPHGRRQAAKIAWSLPGMENRREHASGEKMKRLIEKTSLRYGEKLTAD
jgi:hypothetical protein